MTHSRVMTSPSELERLVYHLRPLARGGDNEWATGFARSILRHSKRPGWRPSTKQLSMMRRLVSELFSRGDEGDLELFEE